MKIRNGFVSNSSSSSFVVYGRDPSKMIVNMPEYLYARVPSLWGDERDTMVLPFTGGELNFGWQFEQYHDIRDRINFCVAMIEDMPEDIRYEKKSMFEDIIKKHMPDKIATINYDYNFFHWDSIQPDNLYIDHQSSWREGENRELFESEKNLEDFIFNSDSYIQCGNDNEDRPESWEESWALREISLHKTIQVGSKFKFDYCYVRKVGPKEGFSEDAIVELTVKSYPEDKYALVVTDNEQTYEVFEGSKYDCEKKLYIYFSELEEVTE